MVGKYAGKVRFNYEGITAKMSSRDLFNNWEADMKGAINTDVIDEGWEPGKMRLEECHRYAGACEKVIVDLIFCCKWGHLPDSKKGDENSG